MMKEQGDPRSAAKAVSERLRSELVSRERVELAAHIGHEGARAALGLEGTGLPKDTDERPGWWKGMAQALPAGFSVHLELESTARAIRTYEAQFVPGLWQTEGYARAVLSARSVSSTPEQVERQVTIRMRRQQILDRAAPPPPQIWAVLDESVIRRAVGGRDVMRAQLARLGEIAAGTTATLQVLPFSAGAHMAAYGSFSLFDPREEAFPVTASTDRPVGTLIEDDPSVIGQYNAIFDHLLATSLSPAESRSLIGEAMRLL